MHPRQPPGRDEAGKSAPLAAAILAGGMARRLGGRPKALLEVHGQTILARQLAILRPLADPIRIVGGDPSLYLPYGVEVVPDIIAGAGALGGIHAALLSARAARVLVVACDMPFLQASLLAVMAATEADVVIPRSARGLEPLCAIYSHRCTAPIRARLARGEREASILPAGLRIVEIGPDLLATYDPDGLMFVNVNTPHDYERARELVDSPKKARRDRIMDDR